mgnify:CR=1 FL=1
MIKQMQETVSKLHERAKNGAGQADLLHDDGDWPLGQPEEAGERRRRGNCGGPGQQRGGGLRPQDGVHQVVGAERAVGDAVVIF